MKNLMCKHEVNMATTPYPKQRSPKSRTPQRASCDVAVIGGGPAGLSAAIYLARFNRTVVVIDDGEGRSTAHQVNENYLGFPRGIAARDLRKKGAAQAARFGATFLDACVTSVRESGDGFALRCGRKVVHARAIIVATGVIDDFPKIADVEQYVGRSLFWCITCDGWKTRGKRILLVGHDDEAATTALQFLEFTDDVSILTNRARHSFSPKKVRYLEQAGIAIHRDVLASVEGRGGRMRAALTEKGERIRLDMMFNAQGSTPNDGVAKMLRLKCKGGYIVVNTEQRTSRKRIYAAGDVTKPHAHQIVTAAHEGATAAQAANYDLYPSALRDS
jgi:thioredoxin reductase (NADPH)